MTNGNEQSAAPKEVAKPTANGSTDNTDQDLTALLKQRLEESRLPIDMKAQILAALPSPVEQERLYRELLEKGGLSGEQLLASLGLEVLSQP